MQKKQRTTITQEQESPISSRPPQDPIMTTIIAWALQGGVAISSLILVIGWLLLLLNPHLLSAHNLQTFPHTFAQIWTGLLALQPQAIIVLGLLLLIATPVIRVAVSLLAFALEHDWLYVVITFFVLSILIIGFLIGKGGA